jgi:molybdopterin molybdotransferase
LREASCADDYDPNSMPVDPARALIRDSRRRSRDERSCTSARRHRVLAADIVSPIDAGPRQSAMTLGGASAIF